MVLTLLLGFSDQHLSAIDINSGNFIHVPCVMVLFICEIIGTWWKIFFWQGIGSYQLDINIFYLLTILVVPDSNKTLLHYVNKFC